jgi:hypothetical protein
MRSFFDKGIFSTIPSHSSIKTSSKSFFFKYYDLLFFLFSFLFSLLSLTVSSSSQTSLFVSLFWGLIVLPLSEFHLTAKTKLIGPSLITGCHLLLFVGFIASFRVWSFHYLEMYTSLIFYYRISINGIVGVNIILFGLLRYGIVHVITSPMIAWALILHAVWVNRILHWSRTR